MAVFANPKAGTRWCKSRDSHPVRVRRSWSGEQICSAPGWSPETPGFLSLRLEVYSPPQVLQIHGRLYHLVLAFLIVEKLQTEGPLCSADITLLHRSYGPIRHPLAVDRFPG